MSKAAWRPNLIWFLLPPLLIFLAGLACSRTAPVAPVPNSPTNQSIASTVSAYLTNVPYELPATPTAGGPQYTPTPDPPRVLPTVRAEEEIYYVAYGDTLGKIAARYNISLEALLAANPLPNPDYLEVGQALTIPQPDATAYGPAFKIIPDSELVYGPASSGFNLPNFVSSKGGYLATYSENIDGIIHTGVQVVERVAQEYSVNPRLLLAVLEYRSGWLTQPNPPSTSFEYPIIRAEAWRAGLYRQLAWTADQLNAGYYRWKKGQLSYWALADGSGVLIAPTINAGTAGVQGLLANLYDRAAWEQAAGAQGLYATYAALYGFPFALAVEPLLPPALKQPDFVLPFESGLDWSFTGGPHGGWGSGSGWAALDFAPPGGAMGCAISADWVTAAANGTVIRAANGAVYQDIDLAGARSNDGYEQTGWVILYLHIDNYERVQAGAYLRAGERIGHASCEGGMSNGTHVHIARKYNGEWIPADAADLPFVMDGWLPSSSGSEYDGFLTKDDVSIEAWESYRPESTLRR